MYDNNTSKHYAVVLKFNTKPNEFSMLVVHEYNSIQITLHVCFYLNFETSSNARDECTNLGLTVSFNLSDLTFYSEAQMCILHEF